MGVSKSAAYKVIAHTAKTESGGKFNAWNPDDTGAGISYGLIQFNQAGGRLASKQGSPLAALLKTMHQLAPSQFQTTFGPYAANLLNESWVKGADFNQPDLKARMLQAASIPKFQEAQLEMARQGYWLPAEAAAKQYGIKSERGHAMLFDTAVQWGPARMKQFLAESAGLHGLGATGTVAEGDILRTFAVKADAGKYNRRTKILADPGLSDASIVGIGVAGVVGIAGSLFLLVRWWRG